MLRRTVILAAPVVLTGCGMVQRIFGMDPGPRDPSAPVGFVTSGERLVYVGDVMPGADAQLAALLETSPDVTTLELDMVAGPQGSDEAIALGRKVRSAGLTTEVRQGSMVKGAGTDVFLAGQPRIIEDGATLSWRGRNMARHPDYAAYLEEMTGTADVSGFLDSEAPRMRSQPLSRVDIQRLELASDGVTGPFTDIGQEMD